MAVALIPQPARAASPDARAAKLDHLIETLATALIDASLLPEHSDAWNAIGARQLANALTRRVMEKTREAVLAG